MNNTQQNPTPVCDYAIGTLICDFVEYLTTYQQFIDCWSSAISGSCHFELSFCDDDTHELSSVHMALAYQLGVPCDWTIRLHAPGQYRQQVTGTSHNILPMLPDLMSNWTEITWRYYDRHVTTPGFPRNPSLAPLPLLFTVAGRALPPVRWMFDFYCALSGGKRDLGNQPNCSISTTHSSDVLRSYDGTTGHWVHGKVSRGMGDSDAKVEF